MSCRIGLIYDKLSVKIVDTIETKYTDGQKKVTKDAIYDILNRKYEVVKILADEKIIVKPIAPWWETVSLPES